MGVGRPLGTSVPRVPVKDAHLLDSPDARATFTPHGSQHPRSRDDHPRAATHETTGAMPAP